MKIKIIILGLLLFLVPLNSSAENISRKLAGWILLQVEKNGEAWYVNPADNNRHYLGRPDDAFRLMRGLGVGITNADLKKIPIALDLLSGKDTDGDGLPDMLEDAIGIDKYKKDTDGDGFDDKSEIKLGYDPRRGGGALLPIDLDFAAQHRGKIFLQVEQNGEAWYVYPKDNKRYFLGRSADAFRIMRELGLGITNDDLKKITAFSPDYEIKDLEMIIHNLINQERKKAGLTELVWNNDLARVAREHSQNLADDNQEITGFGFTCDYPMIRHEGTVFGRQNDNRLNNRGLYYFSRTGENISLIGVAKVQITYSQDSGVEDEVGQCLPKRTQLDREFKAELEIAEDQDKEKIIKQEIVKRKNEYNSLSPVEISRLEWSKNEEIAQNSVVGWMNSPGHKKNILTPEYDEAGIGSVLINGYVISTQVFITRVECGYKGGACCEKKGYYPYCYTPLECTDLICR